MSIKINGIHLALIRTFQYFKHDISEKGPFDFLKDNKKYYTLVMQRHRDLKNQKKFVRGLGEFRSVLDIGDDIATDAFFARTFSYYQNIGKKREVDFKERLMSYFRVPTKIQMTLTPHYPCSIDITPSRRRMNSVVISTLPGSLANAKDVKMNASLRLYPTGLASLRLGWYLHTDGCFQVDDIIDFLKEKETSINVVESTFSEKLSIDHLSRRYKKRLVQGLLSEERPLPNWEDTYSLTNIVESTPLSYDQNFDETLLPLLCLEKNPKEQERKIFNLARGGDEILIPGAGNFIVYCPSASFYDLRKIRRWQRNIIELFYNQKFLIREVQAMELTAITDELRSRYWLTRLRRGILPPKTEHLLSVWNYLNLHDEPFPLKRSWRTRYWNILRILDNGEEIKKAKDQAWNLLQRTVSEAESASRQVGELLRKSVDYVETIGSTLAKVQGKL